MRAKQFALDAENVAVAAAEVEHRFDAGLALDQLAGDLGAHAGAGARTVGHINGVDAVLLAQPGAFDFLAGIDAARRQDFDKRDEAAGGETRAERRFLGRGHFREGLGGLFAFFDAGLDRGVAGLQRTRFAADGLDVLGRSAAAAADDAHAGPQHAARVLRHVLGRAQVEIASFDFGRLAGIGHGAERLAGQALHALERFEHGLRADRAVQADHVGRRLIQELGEGCRARAVEQVAVVVDGHLRDQHGIAAGDFARRQERFAQFVDMQKSLEHQQVDALFHERLDLFAICGARLGERSWTQGFQQHAERSHCAGDEDIGALLCGFASDPDAGAIDLGSFIGEAEAGQLEPVGAEGVGLQNLRTAANVLAMNLADHSGIRQVEFVEAAVDEDALGIEHRAHRAVGDQRAAFQQITECGSPTDSLRHLIHCTVSPPRRLQHAGRRAICGWRRKWRGGATILGRVYSHRIRLELADSPSISSCADRVVAVILRCAQGEKTAERGVSRPPKVKRAGFRTSLKPAKNFASRLAILLLGLFGRRLGRRIGDQRIDRDLPTPVSLLLQGG